MVKAAVVPDVLIESHSAVMGLVFYTGTSFPARYRGGAFAALRGSSGRAKRTGYKVVYLPFSGARATGAYEDFVTGWMLGEDTADVWGRPVGLCVLADGSMLVTDDGAADLAGVTAVSACTAGEADAVDGRAGLSRPRVHDALALRAARSR